MTENKHWAQHTQALAQLLRQTPFGIITDIDGTISPIAPTPEGAAVTETARALLGALSERLRLVAAVSGRAAADARRMIDLPGVEVVGAHGLERWRDGRAVLIDAARPYQQAARAALDEAQALLSRWGITPELKGPTLSLHYRNAPNREALREALYPQIAALAARHGLELFEGRYVLELHPPLKVDKGTAVQQLAAEFELAALVFLGDDVTDLNAFRAVRALREAGRLEGLALGVSSAEGPAAVKDEADLTLDGVPDVERFLGWLLDNVG